MARGQSLPTPNAVLTQPQVTIVGPADTLESQAPDVGQRTWRPPDIGDLSVMQISARR